MYNMNPNESGTGRSWIELDPAHSKPDRMQAFGTRTGFDCSNYDSDVGLIVTGTDRIWVGVDPAHSNTGRAQVCVVVPNSIGSDLVPIWIRLNHVRIGSGVNLTQSTPIQIGCKRVGPDHDSTEPAMCPRWVRSSQARTMTGFDLYQSHSNSGRIQTFWDPNWIRLGHTWSDVDPIEPGADRIWPGLNPYPVQFMSGTYVCVGGTAGSAGADGTDVTAVSSGTVAPCGMGST